MPALLADYAFAIRTAPRATYPTPPAGVLDPLLAPPQVIVKDLVKLAQQVTTTIPAYARKGTSRGYATGALVLSAAAVSIGSSAYTRIAIFSDHACPGRRPRAIRTSRNRRVAKSRSCSRAVR